MLRQSLLIGVAGMAFAGASEAQQRGQSRDDLLDALTRHIQICGEMTETQARLSCYDRLRPCRRSPRRRRLRRLRHRRPLDRAVDRRSARRRCRRSRLACRVAARRR